MHASITPTPQPTTTSSETGAVGLCLSGGGSRALTAGLGQLRALRHLQANGQSLLSQVEVLSTVSGGSWLSVPWTFLTEGTSDAEYLDEYVADPGRLVVCPTDGHSPAETLSVLPPGNPGNHIGSDFSILDMVAEMVVLRLAHDVPWNRMWQSIIARRLLEPYGLFEPGRHYAPKALFSQDATSAQRDIVEPNPVLADKGIHLVAAGEQRERRAELICNTSMFVNKSGSEFQFLAPVQLTPTQAGILGVPPGVTGIDGKPVGGGTVSSFAFGSALVAIDGDAVTVEQDRQLSLDDITGLSSAAFAEALDNFLASTDAEPAKLHAAVLERRDALLEKLGEKPHHHSILRGVFDKFFEHTVEKLLRDLDPRALIPRYRYWPVHDASPNPSIAPTEFADGGSLENTGIAALLTRPRIKKIIAGVNSGDRLEPATHGVLDSSGNPIAGTQVKISSEIPVLFGYRPYQDDLGYQVFGDIPDDDLGADRIYRHNQVFASSDFAPMVAAVAAAAGDTTGLQAAPAIARQRHHVVANEWFGVAGDREVTVVWVYLNDAAAWHEKLTTEVADRVSKIANFPTYSTALTEFDAVAVSAMSSFTAWCVANPDNAQTFVDLFDSTETD